MGFDQFEGVVAEIGDWDERERGEKKWQGNEVNGCFFCVKYMWENDTWGAIEKKEREEKKVFLLWTWG